MEQDNRTPTNQTSNHDLNQATRKGPAEQSPLQTPDLKSEEVKTQPIPLSFFQRYKKWLIAVGVILVLVVVGLIVYKVLVKQKQIVPISTTGLAPLPTQGEIVDKKESSAEIEYIIREKIYETVSIPEGEDFMYYSFDFYKVGEVKSGKYEGGNLILALVTGHGPCKGRGCRTPFRLRYITTDTQAVFLPNISEPNARTGSMDPVDVRKDNPFSKFGLAFAVDDVFTIPALEYTEKLTSSNPEQILNLLKYNMEEDGIFNEELLVPVFEHSIFGAVYTTKQEVAPSESFYVPGPGLVAVPNDTTVAGCERENCFYTNAFYVFRPDGTYLKYSHTPSFSEKDIKWNDQTTPEDDYVYQTVSGCSREPYDYVSVVSTEIVKESDLLPIGKVATTGDVVYGLRGDNHSLYIEFYEKYSQKIPEQYGDMTGFETNTKTYSEFLSSRPLFLWKDPFGRLIRFSNSTFLPPWACEPIIYLYPEVEQKIQVRIGNDVSISDSMPYYSNGWDVIANTKGEITNLSDGWTYPYLFWEGYSYTFPLKEEGFVIKQGEVESFFKDILPKFGLYETETEDFIEAWKPYLSDSPYYFITFIDQEIIDKIAPLQITPKPDSIIRIMMDYKPLDDKIIVPRLDLSVPPEREGFTVVEWGGLRRNY